MKQRTLLSFSPSLLTVLEALFTLTVRKQCHGGKVSPDAYLLLNRTYDVPENPEKRGAKPRFTGSRQKLLEDHLEEYIALRHQSRRKFWHQFFIKWWNAYLWKLGDKEEPPSDDLVRMAELASVEEAEEEAKSKVEAKLVEVCFRVVVVDPVDLTPGGT